MFVEGKPRTVFFLQTLYFTAFIATVEKIITYALGEHDPGSAQDWRTSNDFCSPALNQRVTGIPVPGNSRENQLNFFPLDLEKSISISRSRLETRD